MSSPVLAEGRRVPMRVIVCGVQRTGTLSMRHALFMLGFHNVHHMYSILYEDPEHAPGWTRAIKGKYTPDGKPLTKAEWDNLLSDYQAVVDVPGALFGVELAAAYPDAKVVILNREPEAWYKSVVNSVAHEANPPIGVRAITMFCRLFDPLMRGIYGCLMAVTKLGFGGGQFEDKEKTLAWFHGMYAEYRQNIPKERRLEFSVKDGWGPLCEFLQVPIPTEKDEKTGKVREVPFPRMNDQVMFKALLTAFRKKMIRRAAKNMFALIGVLGLVGVAGYSVWRSEKADLFLSLIKEKL